MAYSPYTWKDDLAGGTPITAARLNAIETGLATAASIADAVSTAFGAVAAGAYKPLAGTGIDLTGATASTAAVNAFFAACTDGDVVVVPPHATIKFDGTVIVGKRIRLTGKGKLSWTGIPNSPALSIQASGSHIDGIFMQGDGIAAQTGNTQYGLQIRANNVRVIGCHVDALQQGITVMPDGEWYNNVIANNVVSNVPGSGDGAANTTSNLGEDRGDGIVNWGASCVITGNRVYAKDGADCRVGIHTEGLSDQAAVTTYPHRDSMVSITGNVVTGKFRRGIVTEAVGHTTITGNSVADATWWGIAIINTFNSIAAHNTIKWTRTSSDNQGAAWSVNRSGLMIYGTGQNNIVQGNTVTARSGSAWPFGIYVQTDAGGSQDDLLIADNILVDNSASLGNGIYMNGASSAIARPRVVNNRVSGYSTTGVYGWACGDPEILSNRLDGIYNTKNGNGVRMENSSTGMRCDGNYISWAGTAILAVGRNAVSTFNNNLVYNANYGIDLYGTSGASVVGNRMVSVTTATNNMPSGYTNFGNNF